MKPDVLVLLNRPAEEIELIGRDYTVHYAPDPASREEAVKSKGELFQAVITSGTLGLTASEIAAMPKLEIITCVGAGYDGVDVAAARKAGVAVTHGPNTNNSTAADHAFSLLLAIARGIPQSNDAVKKGVSWAKLRQDRPLVLGKRLGILGLGKVGLEVARRSSGFEMKVSYHNRNKRDDVPYEWKPSVRILAAESDFLVLTLPGGAATRHIIDAEILDALGPSGYLINIGRGSLVDTNALMKAVKERRIAGAALDVIEGEPAIPAELSDIPDIIITPHIGWLSPESRRATIELILQNLAAHFAGRPLVTPVPEG